jgi:hypothetical protein
MTMTENYTAIFCKRGSFSGWGGRTSPKRVDVGSNFPASITLLVLACCFLFLDFSSSSAQVPATYSFDYQIPAGWFWQEERPSRYYFAENGGELVFRVYGPGGGTNRLLRSAPVGPYSFHMWGDYVDDWVGQTFKMVMYSSEDNYVTLVHHHAYNSYAQLKVCDQGEISYHSFPDEIPYDLSSVYLGYLPELGSLIAYFGDVSCGNQDCPLELIIPISFTPSYIGFEPYSPSGFGLLEAGDFDVNSFPYILPPEILSVEQANGAMSVEWMPNDQYPIYPDDWTYSVRVEGQDLDWGTGEPYWFYMDSVSGLSASTNRYTFDQLPNNPGCSYRLRVYHISSGNVCHNYSNVDTAYPSVEMDGLDLSFTYSIDPSTATVIFSSEVGGFWDFGDGHYSWYGNPTHTYNVPPCMSNTYEVRHLRTFGLEVCSTAYVDYVTVHNNPPPGSRGIAYVIVGDVDVHNDEVDDAGYFLEKSAMDAKARLEAQGYTVYRYGEGFYGGQRATLSEMDSALSDPFVKAIWFFGHGGQHDNVDGVLHLSDGYIVGRDIQALREESGSTLDQLSVLSCYAGLYDGIEDRWKTAPGAVIDAPVGTMHFMEPFYTEEGRACDPAIEKSGMAPIGNMGAMQRVNSIARSPIVPMAMKTIDGLYGDQIYGTISGLIQTTTVDGTGVGVFASEGGDISGSVHGLVPGDSLIVCGNTYRKTPMDTVPDGRSTLKGLMIDGNREPDFINITVSYSDSWVPDPDAMEFWAFDAGTRAFNVVPATIDTTDQNRNDFGR